MRGYLEMGCLYKQQRIKWSGKRKKEEFAGLWNEPWILQSLLDLDERSTGAVRPEERHVFYCSFFLFVVSFANSSFLQFCCLLMCKHVLPFNPPKTQSRVPLHLPASTFTFHRPAVHMISPWISLAVMQTHIYKGWNSLLLLAGPSRPFICTWANFGCSQMHLSSGGWIMYTICVYVYVGFVSVVCEHYDVCMCVCVFEGYKRISAGSILEGWGLWLRSGSAGALL